MRCDDPQAKCKMRLRSGLCGVRCGRFRGGRGGIRWRCLLPLLFHLLERIKAVGRHRCCGRGRGCWSRIEHRLWRAAIIGQNRQAEASDEKDRRQNAGGPRQRIGLAAPGHEPAPAALPQSPALRALQQHGDNKGRDHHEVDGDEDGLHGMGPLR